MKKVVTIGGGTGHYTLLRGLKNYDIDIYAIVSMVDSGGSTGKLRDEFGYLPPGDLRQCLVALSEAPELLRKIFNFRIGKDSVGNYIIAAAEASVGKDKYVQELGKILRIKGKVIPITIDNTHLYATTSRGRKLKKEEEVSYGVKKGEKIVKIWLEPQAYIFRDAAEAIRKADLIVICPGELYGSIIPNFLVKGMEDALNESKARLVYVCNLVTKQGTYGFKAKDFVTEIEKYAKRKIDIVILNTKKPTQRVVDKYKGEESYFVEPDIGNLERKVIKEELLTEWPSDGKILARHDPEKTARLIMDIL